HLPVGFRDIHPPNWGPPVTLMADVVDELPDLLQGHAIRGPRRGPLGERTGVPVDPPVRPQVEVRVGEPSVDLLQVKASSASVLNDGQGRFGVPHVAYLPTRVIAPT